MCGASVSTIVGSSIKTSMRLVIAFALSIAAFSTMALVAGGQNALCACFVAFLAFEFCCGLYFPSIGVLKSDVVPEQVRGTMYNIYRVPLNAVVVCLLLSNISMIKCFTLCAILMSIAMVSMVSIWLTPRSTEDVSMNKPA